MSSTAAASAYWRVAGMTYLKYAELASGHVRAALKPEPKAVAKTREAVYFRSSQWAGGKPAEQVVTDLTGEGPK
jgi:F-type H+-transporting ATPase subunit epsilon